MSNREFRTVKSRRASDGVWVVEVRRGTGITFFFNSSFPQKARQLGFSGSESSEDELYWAATRDPASIAGFFTLITVVANAGDLTKRT